jgi:pimeloyl-ACP methyl ester carboxylesterase
MARLSPRLRAVALGAGAFYTVAPGLMTEVMWRHFTRPRRKPGYDYRPRLPAGARHLTVPHGELELVAWSWGESGPALLLVHGWEDHSGSMLGFVEPLRALGYRIFVLDAPGHGLSPRVATHLLDVSHAVETMTRLHGPFASIVAHSFGAAATCVMLGRDPSLKPERLALISPMQGIDQHLDVFADIALLSEARYERLRRRVYTELQIGPGEVCALRAVSCLDMPGLIIHDRNDPVIPHDVGVQIAEQWGAARFVSTDRLGHRRVLKCPNVLREVLNHHE